MQCDPSPYCLSTQQLWCEGYRYLNTDCPGHATHGTYVCVCVFVYVHGVFFNIFEFFTIFTVEIFLRLFKADQNLSKYQKVEHCVKMSQFANIFSVRN